MDLISLAGLAVALAMDAFAVALAAGTVLRPLTFRPCFRLAFHFGLFQGLMPIIGWLAGVTVRDFVAAWSHWLAFGLLLFIGIRMIREAVAEGDDGTPTDPSKGVTMVVLSIATSIDALAVGLTLAMIQVEVWFPALIIGLVASFFTLVGLLLGNKAGDKWGSKVEIAGGSILIVIGCKILFGALAG